ncbi:MAG: BolA family transcriptional regulator [Rhodospirillaceae bacterium]|nr:BolA family transcriptional regulator [Rhodospirillaceae bacterium]|tara:strand:+ start:538 stop:804 length:267 start_codon:yes stop_codon:yes gene_type:complete
MRVAEIIKNKLEKLEPALLEIIDESHLHAGHAGARDGGESHFRVNIVSEVFNDLNRVARQRMIYEILSEELEGPIHALALSTKTPAEE